MSGSLEIKQVMVTGATGFVGRAVVRELLARGLTPVCLVRSAHKLFEQHRQVDPSRMIVITGSLSDGSALRHASDLSQACIHLVGIILARPLRRQTFHQVHVVGTRNVVDATAKAGIRRHVQMSALGTRPDAPTPYHQTKWAAEEYVRRCALDWTIFRPSLIHGPDGEFMRLMKRLICGLVPPVIPCFGSGESRVQPVSVKDVACCTVQCLCDPSTIGKTFPMGGPRAYSWRELYNACRATMPGARHWKPIVSQPVSVGKMAAMVGGPLMGLAEMIMPSLGLYRFDAGQVQMSQENNICDHTIAERAFSIRMRAFEDELALYAEQIR